MRSFLVIQNYYYRQGLGIDVFDNIHYVVPYCSISELNGPTYIDKIEQGES